MPDIVKLRLKYGEAELQVEGTSEFVSEERGKFLQTLPDNPGLVSGVIQDTDTQPTKKAATGKSKPKASQKRKKSSASAPLSRDTEFIRKHGAKFAEHLDKYDYKGKPATKLSCLFIYILRNEMDIKEVTLQLLYTCYDQSKEKMPDIRKSIANAQSKSKTVFRNGEYYAVTHRGENLANDLLSKD